MSNLTKDQSDAFEQHMNAAKTLHDSQPDDFHSTIGKHAEHMTTYVNSTIRNNTTPTIAGLHSHIAARHQKLVDGVSTKAAKDKKLETMNSDLSHLDNNKKHFTNALKIHHHMQEAKNILVNGLNSASKNSGEMEHHIDGKETNPEGYVAHYQGKPIKLVNRGEFSRANFLASKEWKK